MKLFKREPVDDNTHNYELEEVLQTAAQGRRLAIYDRATNLYAYWYLQLRGDEEVARARRYSKPLSLVSVWATEPDTITAVAAHLNERLRDTDLAGYLNNGHFVIILAETAMDGAAIVLERAAAQFGDAVEAAAVTYPADGETFDELLERAKSRASEQKRRAA